MEQLENILKAANSIIVVICQFLAMVVISIGIAKASKIYLADVLTPGRSARLYHRNPHNSKLLSAARYRGSVGFYWGTSQDMG